jgi:hypothetical protein
MSYVIARRNVQRRAVEYVTEQGSERSFTPLISKARRYTTYSEALQDLCPFNERIVAI